MPDLRTDYKNDILAEEMNGKRRFKIVKSDGTSEVVTIEDVTEYEQIGSLFGAGDLNHTNQVANEVYHRPVNNNLLINSNFANPVNQRGFTTATGVHIPVYTVDRWYLLGTNSSLNKANGYVTLSPTNVNSDNIALYQRLENLPKGTYAISAKINEKIYDAVLNWNNEYTDKEVDDGIYLLFSYSNNIPTIGIAINPNKIPSANIEWVKLELGNNATPYVPRPYQEEWVLCQRYFHKLHALLPQLLYETYNVGGNYILVREGFNVMRAIPTIKTSSIFNHSGSIVASVDSSNIGTDVLGWIRPNTNLSVGKYFLYAELDAEL